MAGSSNPPPHASAQTQEDVEYSYALNANFSNFVSVKLSGEGNYHRWETQMLCLLTSHSIRSIVDGEFKHPRSEQYDSLVKGWIFGSINEGLLDTVVDLASAKEVWDKLKSFYGSTMMNSEEGSSNPPRHASAEIQEDLEYSNALNANFSSFVSVKLSGEGNYHLWKTQMLCLLESHGIRSIVDSEFKHPRSKQYDSLVKGWIFGSISEGLLGIVVDLGTAKKVWDKLKYFYGSTMTNSEQEGHEDSTQKKQKRKIISEDNDPRERKTEGRDVASTEDKEAVLTEVNAKGKARISPEDRNNLWKAIVEGRWFDVESIIQEKKDVITTAIDGDGNTVLHIVVGTGLNYFVRQILSLISPDILPNMKNLKGSTALHIAAIVGNTRGADLLIKKNLGLLKIQDGEHETPLHKAFRHRHLDTIIYLLKPADHEGKTKKESSPSTGADMTGYHLLIEAISAKKYDYATVLVKTFPNFAVENDKLLMAIAKTFPSGLDYLEKLMYPIMGDILPILVEKAKYPFSLLVDFYRSIKDSWDTFETMSGKIVFLVVMILFQIPLLTLLWIAVLILVLLWMVYFPFFIFYWLLWDVAARLGVPPFKQIVEKKREWENAKEILKLVCNKMDKFPDYYKEPILEAARQNTREVVNEILVRFPEAIWYKDINGYDIIQLAVIHRSEKIYNLLYIFGERKLDYRIIEDSLKNNMLHLAGILAPLHKLKRSKGAAFQLQRELQWREEVKKIVYPTYITRKNYFNETPDMVFTREHENLVKEGEKWMRAVAESCSITASLIITIVFAAAITVPGGSNQETGIPLFTEDVAFTIFALSDATSLFASSTALLMFLSILTGRFAEQDFLVSLPRRLRIGLCTLMISTTAMMVAFGATMFIVFCGRKPWMLAPICVSAFLPIASFGTLQFHLIVDLFRPSFEPMFDKKINITSYIINKIRIFAN